MALGVGLNFLPPGVTFNWRALHPEKSLEWERAMDALIKIYPDRLVAEKVYPGMADVAATEGDAKLVVQRWNLHIEQYVLECVNGNKNSPVYQIVFQGFSDKLPQFAEALFSKQFAGEVLSELEKLRTQNEDIEKRAAVSALYRGQQSNLHFPMAVSTHQSKASIELRLKKLRWLLGLCYFQGSEAFYLQLIVRAEKDSKADVDQALNNLMDPVLKHPHMQGKLYLPELITYLFEGEFQKRVREAYFDQEKKTKNS